MGRYQLINPSMGLQQEYNRQTDRIAILREVKLKIELPRWRPGWVVPLLVHKCEAQLYYLEQIHIAAQQLVLIVSVASELSDRSGYNTWKLRVLQADESRWTTEMWARRGAATVAPLTIAM